MNMFMFIPGFRIRISSKSGSGGLHFKRRDIFRRLSNDYFRYYQKTPFLFLYFCFRTSPVRIFPGSGALALTEVFKYLLLVHGQAADRCEVLGQILRDIYSYVFLFEEIVFLTRSCLFNLFDLNLLHHSVNTIDYFALTHQ